MTDLRTVTHEHFKNCSDATFKLRTDEGVVVDLKLASVDVLSHPPQGDQKRQGFCVIFEGPAEPLLPQQVYQIAHADIGELDIFVVPIAQDGQCTRYEAVFN